MPKGQPLSAHQKKIVDRYYANIDTISLTKLQELVTELYLATSDKKRDTLWARADKALAKLDVPPKRLATLQRTRSPEDLAALITELSKKT